MKSQQGNHEEALIERLLTLKESGMTSQAMEETLRREGYGSEASEYVALLDLLSEERDRLDVVTPEPANRYILGREEAPRSTPHQYWETLMQYLKPRYALTFGVVLLVVLVSVNMFDTNTETAQNEGTSTATSVVAEKTPTPTPVESEKKVATSSPVPSQAPRTPSEQGEIDTLLLAVVASEGTETFTDDDAELDITSDDVLIDNNTMYDESLF